MVLVPFLFWGIGSIGENRGGEEKLPSAGGITVSPARLKEASFDGRVSLLIEFVEGNNIKTAEQFDMYRNWFNQLMDQIDLNKIAVQQIILQNETKSYRISASMDEIKNWILNFPLFQTRNTFDIERYNAIVSSYFQSWPAQFENALARILAVKKLGQFITDTVLISHAEAFNAYKEKNEKAEVYYVEFTTADYIKNVVKIEDSELQAYYDSHKEDFRKPEGIKIMYLLFDPSAYKEKIAIQQKEIEDYYESHKEEFSVKEKGKEEIVKPLEQVANDIKQKLTNQAADDICQEDALNISILLTKEKRIGDMIKLAHEKNRVLKETDYLPENQPFLPELGQIQQLMQTAWRMDMGTISDVLHVNDKWVIISPAEKKPSEIPELNEVKEKIKGIIKNKKAEELTKQFGEETLKKLPKNMPFTSAVKSMGLKLKKTKPITKSNELFTKTTRLLQTPKGTVLVHMKRFYPVDEKTWEKEKDKFTKACLDQKKRKFFQQWLTSLMK